MSDIAGEEERLLTVLYAVAMTRTTTTAHETCDHGRKTRKTNKTDFYFLAFAF